MTTDYKKDRSFELYKNLNKPCQRKTSVVLR